MNTEGTTSTPSEAGTLELEFLVFPNTESVFVLMNNEVRNIGEKGYLNTLRPVLQDHGGGTSIKMAGHFDEAHNEYWLDISLRGEERYNFKFFMENFNWIGTQDYYYDNYMYSGGKSYGVKNLKTYELNSGTLIDGLPIEYSLTQIFSQEIMKDKEFSRIGIETGGREGEKPTSIEFYDKDFNLIGEMSEAASGGDTDWLMQYDQWEQFIPRRSDNGDRMQDRLLIYKIIHNLEADFKVVNSTIQFKVLK